MPKNVIIVAVPDLHFPFHNRKALKALYSHLKKLKTRYKNHRFIVVQLGDIYDQYCFSFKFPRNQNIITPKEELDLARADAESFWERIKTITGASECYQLRGNHDDRVMKLVYAKSAALSSLVHDALTDYYTFDGVITQPDSRTELELYNTLFIHGWMTGTGKHVNYCTQSVVHGHTHKGNITYKRYKDRLLFELDCGYLADRFQAPMCYTPQKTINHWTLGYGIIDELGQRFISLQGVEHEQGKEKKKVSKKREKKIS